MREAPLLQLKPGVLTRQVESELVLLDVSTERYLGLNTSAARMWALATTTSDLDAALAALAVDYPDTAPERLAADFSAFIAKVRDAGLTAD